MPALPHPLRGSRVGAAFGSDLSRPLEIDFFVAVPTEEVGQAVARRVSALGFRASVEQDRETQEWTCYCSRSLVPDYAEVVRVEQQLGAVASELGGYLDGFGSFGNAQPRGS